MIGKARMLIVVGSVPGVPSVAAILRPVIGLEAAPVVAAGIPSSAIAVLEYMSHRAKSSEDRVAEAVDDDVFRNALLVSMYLVLAIQVFQGLVGFFVGLGMGAALGSYDVKQGDIMTAAGLILIPLMCAFLVLASKFAAHRIRAHRFEWLGLAIVLTCLVNIGSFLLFYGSPMGLNLTLIVGILLVYTAYLAAVAVGVVWANRGQALYRLGRAYRAMPSDDRLALVDLALGELPERSSSPLESQPQVVRVPHRPDRVGATSL